MIAFNNFESGFFHNNRNYERLPQRKLKFHYSKSIWTNPLYEDKKIKELCVSTVKLRLIMVCQFIGEKISLSRILATTVQERFPLISKIYSVSSFRISTIRRNKIFLLSTWYYSICDWSLPDNLSKHRHTTDVIKRRTCIFHSIQHGAQFWKC